MTRLALHNLDAVEAMRVILAHEKIAHTQGEGSCAQHVFDFHVTDRAKVIAIIRQWDVALYRIEQALDALPRDCAWASDSVAE